jgi:hypothetical protein
MDPFLEFNSWDRVTWNLYQQLFAMLGAKCIDNLKEGNLNDRYNQDPM